MKVELTTESLQRFIGGEALVDVSPGPQRHFGNPWQPLDYRYRGRIKEITVRDNQLHIFFVWAARHLDAEATAEKQWRVYTGKDPRIFSYLPLFEEQRENDGVLTVHSSVFSETVTLYPPGGDAIDPDAVEDFPREHYEEQLARFRLTSNRPEGP